jgi:hypothetical protein
MFKKTLEWRWKPAFAAAFLLCLTLLLPQLAHADQTPTTQTTSISTPAWFNGSWLSAQQEKTYGAPGDTVAPSVIAQQQAYLIAKKSKDLDGMLKNALWTSVQAWAYNNAGRDAAWAGNSDKSISYYLLGLNLLDAAQPISSADFPDQFNHEMKEREAAKDKLSSNLLYEKRVTGAVPWPTPTPGSK